MHRGTGTNGVLEQIGLLIILLSGICIASAYAQS